MRTADLKQLNIRSFYIDRKSYRVAGRAAFRDARLSLFADLTLMQYRVNRFTPLYQLLRR